VVNALDHSLHGRVNFYKFYGYNATETPCVTVFSRPHCAGKSDAFCVKEDSFKKNAFDKGEVT